MPNAFFTTLSTCDSKELCFKASRNYAPLIHLIKGPLYAEITFAVHCTTYFGVICKLTNHASYIHIHIKSPQVIRKIRVEQYSDATGNLKLWCQFFNILSDSTIMWQKDGVHLDKLKQ
eukprot:g23441.t1